MGVLGRGGTQANMASDHHLPTSLMMVVSTFPQSNAMAPPDQRLCDVISFWEMFKWDMVVAAACSRSVI